MSQRYRLFSSLAQPTVNDEYKRISAALDRHMKKFHAGILRKHATSKNSKLLFRHVSQFTKEKVCSHTFSDDSGRKYRGDVDKAEALAKHFASVFKNSGNRTFRMDTTERSRKPDSVPFILPWEISQLLKKLKSSTFRTSDGIPQIVYKRCADQLAEPLSIIINLSLREGKVPQIWKHGVVIPIPKKPNASKLSDFRPICINPVACKIAEKFLKKKLLQFCELHSLIPEQQFGFLQGASTTAQLISCDYEWKRALAHGEKTDVLFFDLSKAFDRLNPNILLEKLFHLGLSSNILK
ncbi:hypothetical protein Y032_0304g1919 [Ancylostoma ceylanicum]|uniref:Reverse transcriptase domain-containing protein n=1 Tax=Ancylostoma ceylanicum TaxID=53326 RepID=A0A016S391_9BILA|nr:hypothetical protein Y032_0304g1919 [Ancylostoma ceylanicum]